MIQVFRRLIFKAKKTLYKKKEERHDSTGRCFSHVTIYASRNAGDTVLSKCVRETIFRLGSVERWNLIGVRDSVTDKTLKKIRETSALLIGGGGLFLPDSNKNVISGWQWAISKEQLNQIDVPIIIYSVGYNYFRGQESSDLFEDNLKYLCEKANFIGLRNSGSIRAVRELVGEHLAKKLYYQPCTTTLIRKLYEDRLPEKTKTNAIGFNLAFDRSGLRFGEKKELILQQVAKAASLIEKRGYRIIYIMHCYDDKEFVPYLKKEGIPFQVCDMSDWFPEECFRFYNTVDLVFGMRGHAQMIPFGLNCEIISLGTHEKMRWFLEDIEACDWYEELTFEPETLSKRLLDKFIQVHEIDSENTQKRLLAQQEKLWEITLENWNTISKLL